MFNGSGRIVERKSDATIEPLSLLCIDNRRPFSKVSNPIGLTRSANKMSQRSGATPLEFGWARRGAALLESGVKEGEAMGIELGDALGVLDGECDRLFGTTFTLPPMPLPTINIKPASAAYTPCAITASF